MFFVLSGGVQVETDNFCIDHEVHKGTLIHRKETLHFVKSQRFYEICRNKTFHFMKYT